MGESQQLSQVIGAIYDAALDRELWPSVLEQTCGFVGGQTAGLVAQRPSQGKAEFFVEWGTEPEFLESYRKTYVMINPANISAMLYSKIGEVSAASDYIPYEELVKSRIYKEWLAPQGIVDAMYVVLQKSAISYSAIAVQRNKHQGFADHDARRRLSLLAPHFSRAVAIGQIIDFRKFEAAAFADSLDGLAAAMLLVDADGRLTHVNAAGHAMLEAGDPIRAVGGKLGAVDPQADGILRDFFVQGVVKGVDVPLTARGGDGYIAHVLPLTSGARRQAGATYSAVAALFVRKVELELPHPLETIAGVFKLTSAEMRVLMTIVQLGGIREVASVLGIGEPTVKTHLQHVFEKTGASRQADLVKLVAGYMSPLAQ
jgi:DNA-binding CsgD family transcriptional regulator